MVDKITLCKVNKQKIYRLSVNKTLGPIYPENKSREIVHFINKTPKIWFDRNYWELPMSNRLYSFDKLNYYPKLIDYLVKTNAKLFYYNYTMDRKYFTPEVILEACKKNIDSLRFIPPETITQDIADQIIRIDIAGIKKIPNNYINIDNITDFINIYALCNSGLGIFKNVLTNLIQKINPEIIMGVIDRGDKYMKIIISYLNRDSTNDNLKKMILYKYPQTIKDIKMGIDDEKYGNLFVNFPKAKCFEFIKYQPEIIRYAPSGYFTADELIDFTKNTNISTKNR